MSDSDSGNGDVPTDKRPSTTSNVTKSTARKSSQQHHRRHARQNGSKSRGGGGVGSFGSTTSRSESSRSSWTKQKGGSSIRGKTKPPLNSGANNNKEKRSTLTDTDSGQEMNSPYEGLFVFRISLVYWHVFGVGGIDWPIQGLNFILRYHIKFNYSLQFYLGHPVNAIFQMCRIYLVW